MKYAVSELKARLTQALREVETGKTIEVTRHGKSVAVLIATDDYENLMAARPGFTLKLHALRESADFTPSEEDDFNHLRDKGTGREVIF